MRGAEIRGLRDHGLAHVRLDVGGAARHDGVVRRWRDARTFARETLDGARLHGARFDGAALHGALGERAAGCGCSLFGSSFHGVGPLSSPVPRMESTRLTMS